MAEVVGALIIESLIADTTIAAFSAGGWAVTVATPATTLLGLSAATVGSAALVGASLVGGALIAGKPSAAGFSTPGPTDGTQTIKQAIPPRIVGYGRARIAGAYVFYDSDASGNSYDVIALHYGRIEAFNRWYLNDDAVLLDGSGWVYSVYTNNPAGAGSRYFNNFGGGAGQPIGGGVYSYVQIQSRLGQATETAYDSVVSAFPSTWTAAHRGDGIASAALKCSVLSLAYAPGAYSSTYPRGLPKLSVIADLSPIYDPRDGTQSRSDSSTWRVSRNPVVQIMNYLTDEARGVGQDWDTIIEPNLAALIAQADICDERMTRANGTTEARYASSGWFTMDTDPAEVLGSILAACDGWMAERGDGTIAIVVGKYTTPTKTITDQHILGFSIDHGVSDEEAVNELKFTYCVPANDYREGAGDPYRDEQSVSDTGRVRSQSLRLGWVQSHSQARRLAKRAMQRHQARLRGSLTVSLFGLTCLGERWLNVQSDLVADLSDAVIEVSRARVDIQNGRVTFEWILTNPNAIDAWEPESEEGTEPNFPGSITQLRIPSGVSAAGSGGRIQVTINDPADTSLVYVVQHALSGSEAWVEQVFLTYTPSGGSIVFTTDTVAGAGNYDVRIAAIDSENIQSAWATTTATV